MAFALLKTWYRYCNGVEPANCTAAALTTSVAGPVEGLTPPTGDCVTGANTFNVEPSGAVVGVPPGGGVVGVRGVLEFDVHASANPSSTATPMTATRFRDIKSSKTKYGNLGGWSLRILTESIS